MPDEAGRELRVEDARGAHAVARREQQEVARGGMHDQLHAWVADELGDRPDVDVLERIDHRQTLRRGQLEQARHRAVGALPDEFRVEREPPLIAGGLGERPDLRGIPQVLDRGRAHCGLLPDARVGSLQGVNRVASLRRISHARAGCP